MEDDDSETQNIFESLNLNPQLFINEVLNIVDDAQDEAFECFEQQALERICSTSEEGEALRKGTSVIRSMIQEALNKRLAMWEKYCLQHCFSVPEGLSLPNADTSSVSLNLDPGADQELDNQLDSLREELSAAQRDAVKLQRELHAMRNQSIANRHVESVKDALKQFEQASVHDMFQEIVKAADGLRTKLVERENKRKLEMERVGTEKTYNINKDPTSMLHIKGLSGERLSGDDLLVLQDHLADI